MASGRLERSGPDQAKVTLELEDGSRYPLAGSLKFSEITVDQRSEEHTSELQSLMRISYAVFCLKKKKTNTHFQLTHIYITCKNDSHRTHNHITRNHCYKTTKYMNYHYSDS